MKYIKLFEWFGKQHPNYEWKNITIEDGNIVVYVYDLADEMERTVLGTNKYIIKEKEDEYINLVKKLLLGKVITFTCTECREDTHTGICERVEFVGNGYPGGPQSPDDRFDIAAISIELEDSDMDHNLESDKIIIHLDIDPQIYRDSKDYNI